MTQYFKCFDKNGKEVRDGACITGDTFNRTELIKRFKKDARVVKIIENGKEIWKR